MSKPSSVEKKYAVQPAEFLNDLFLVGLSAADLLLTVPPHLPAPPKGRTVVIGAGKAAAAMAKAVEDHWPNDRIEGLVVTRYEYGKPTNRIQVLEAAHPVPDDAGEQACQLIFKKLEGLTKDDLVLALISGGGSALLSAPALCLTSQEKRGLNSFWRKFDQTKDFPEMAGKQLRAWFDFDIQAGAQLLVKVALSSVSTDGALRNMAAEVPHWDFGRVVREGQDGWRKELDRIKISSRDPDVLKNFYTAMYHACLSPTVYMDVDGQYRGLDQNVHKAEGFTNHTTFSLWDTYRALHPLFNIIQRERSSDLINSMLAHYDQSAQHMLPIWSITPMRTGV